MKQVDVIFTGHLNSIIGPVQTLKRLKRDRDYFEEHGFGLNIFTSDLLPSSFVEEFKNSGGKKVSWMKRLANQLADNSLLFDIIRLQSIYHSKKKLARYYHDLNRHPDIIVFHSMLDCYAYLKYFRIEGVKVALFVHSETTHPDMLMYYFKRAKGTFVEKRLNKINEGVLREVDIVNSISKIGEVNFKKERPFLIGKTNIVINGIDDLTEDQKAETISIRKTTKQPKYRLICTGSINERKGQRLIIDAFKELAPEKQEQFDIVFVGDGQIKPTLEEKVNTLKLNKNIHFAGAIPNSEVYRNLAEANIFILMSNKEGLPLSMLEAIRSGLPVISTCVSGIPEVAVEGKNGVLIEPNSKQLLEVFENIDNYDWYQMGVNSREHFEKVFTFDRMREDYLKMLEGLC